MPRLTLARLTFAPLLAATLPLLATPAIAQQAAKKPAARAGASTAARVSPQLKAEFDKSDKNKDGFLSRAEVEARVQGMAVGGNRFTPAMRQELAATWFARADANKDGKISPLEMQRLMQATAARYDTNGDGVVSIQEREAARAAAMAEARGKTGPVAPSR